MSEAVIYQEPGKPAAIIASAPACELSISEIADKDVPSGIAYWIVKLTEIDALYAQHGQLRDAWEISQETMGRVPDGVGK